MKKYLFINYFSDKDEERKKEYLFCLQKNLELKFLDKIFIFVEDEECKHDIPKNDKVIFVNITKRMEYRDVIDFANKTLEPNSIFIVSLLDIFIEDSDAWANIDKEFFEIGFPFKAIVCKRHNYNLDGSIWIEDESWRKGEFWDAMVLKTPLNSNFMNEDLNFCIGNSPQGDNTMMYLLSKYYHTYSWGAKYKIFHVDNCRKTTGSQMILNPSTDYRAAVRKQEHLDIPAFQNWEHLLKTGIEPKYLPTWRMYTLTIIFGD